MSRKYSKLKNLGFVLVVIYSAVSTAYILQMQYSMRKAMAEISAKSVEEQNVFQRAWSMLQHSDTLSNSLSVRQIGTLSDIFHQLAQATDSLPTIYAITPTHTRHEQKPELFRLCHTFLLVPKLHWIVVEDSQNRTMLVANLLKNCGVPFTHLTALTNPKFKLKSGDKRSKKPRGVAQRNAALKWLRTTEGLADGVVYFADDDNTYSTKIFEEMRFTRSFSVWPVGLLGGVLYEAPVVKDGQVVGFHVGWNPARPFATDMASFAVNLNVVRNKTRAYFRNRLRGGYQESHILKSLGANKRLLEPRAKNCTEILVWHTRSQRTSLHNEKKILKLPKHLRVNLITHA